MQALVLFGLFCVFPALFCYTLETAAVVVDDDESSLVDIAGEAGVEVEARDLGLESDSDALDNILRVTRHCPHCNGCHCYEHGCVCCRRRVKVYLAYMDACKCRPCFSAIFHIGRRLIFGECIPKKSIFFCRLVNPLPHNTVFNDVEDEAFEDFVEKGGNAATNGCHKVCKGNYCFNFCIDKNGDEIDGILSELHPDSVEIGHFKLNL